MNDKTPLRELKGVGEKTEKLFQKIGITTAEELLRYYPRTYDIYEEPVEIASAEEDKTVSIRATITTGIYINQIRNLPGSDNNCGRCKRPIAGCPGSMRLI